MKKITLILSLLISAQANAFRSTDFNEESVVYNEPVSVHDLNCSISIGQPGVEIEDRMVTVLNGLRLRGDSIEMKHETAGVKGCDFEVLDLIKQEALRTSFGHIFATVTVVKNTGKKPRVVFGKCQRNYNEHIELDLGQNVVLKTSPRGKLIPASGCE